MNQIYRRRSLSAVLLLLAILFRAPLQAQELLSIPVPADANLEIVPDRIRPDGSQFIVLVRIAGSSPIKYVASREDVVRSLEEQLAALAESNSLSETSLGNLKRQQSSLQDQVRELAASKLELLRALAATKGSQAELQSALPGTDRESAEARGEQAGEGVSSAVPGSDESMAEAASRLAAPAAKSVEEMLEAELPRAGLLSVPIDPANVRLEMGRAKPDGSRFQMFVHSGGIRLQYVAGRNDVVLKQDQQLKLLLALHSLYERRLANARTKKHLLEQKQSLLEADIGDLQQAVHFSRQNIEVLAEAMEARKKGPFEILMGVLPAIVSIVAVAATN